MIKGTNIYYFRGIQSIGGIESHLYYVARKYGSRDITVLYREADPGQLARLKRYVRCVEWTFREEIRCERIFCCFNREVLPFVTEGEKCLVLHGDYIRLLDLFPEVIGQLPVDPLVDRYFGVSQTVCDSWKEATGLDAECLYEPIVLDKAEKPIRIVSTTRLSSEKGWDNYRKMAGILDAAGVSYIWDMYTNNLANRKNDTNIRFVDPVLNVADLLPAYDIFCHLSSTEGYGLSVVEAWMRGLPCLITDIPVLRELGANEDNSYIVDQNLENIDVDKIRNLAKKKFRYTPVEDRWSDVIIDRPSSYRIMKVYATEKFEELGVADQQTGRIPKKNEPMWIDFDRFEVLSGKNPYKAKFVDRRPRREKKK